MSSKSPRARKPKSEGSEPSQLLSALQFISVAQHSEGLPYQMHCKIANGKITATNGGISASTNTDDGLQACPQTSVIMAALKNCSDAISITKLDSGKLSIKSGKFRALVPCVEFEALGDVIPDPACANINDDLKRALLAVSCLAKDDKADNPLTACILLKAYSAVATNRHVVLEAWHGIDLPPNIQLPKASVLAICKTEKKLKAFGFSENSATFYYDDDSFIKTALFSLNYPDTSKVLIGESEANAWPLPPEFYDALDRVASFSETNSVFFKKNRLQSHNNPDIGASCDVEGLPDGFQFNVEYLKMIRPYALKIHLGYSDRGLSVFFGENIRGGIMGMTG